MVPVSFSEEMDNGILAIKSDLVRSPVDRHIQGSAEPRGSMNKGIGNFIESSFVRLCRILDSPTDLISPHGELQDSAPWNSIRPRLRVLPPASICSFDTVSFVGQPKMPILSEKEEDQMLLELELHTPASRHSRLNGSFIYEPYEMGSSPSESTDGDEANSLKEEEAQIAMNSNSNAESMEGEHGREPTEEGTGLIYSSSGMKTLRRNFTSSDDGNVKARRLNKHPRPQLFVNCNFNYSSRTPFWRPPPLIYSKPVAQAASCTLLPHERIPQRNKHFMECADEDISMCDIGELLRDYRRIVQAAKNAGLLEMQ